MEGDSYRRSVTKMFRLKSDCDVRECFKGRERIILKRVTSLLSEVNIAIAIGILIVYSKFYSVCGVAGVLRRTGCFDFKMLL